MDIKVKLDYLGYVENTDYIRISDSTFEMLPKFRTIINEDNSYYLDVYIPDPPSSLELERAFLEISIKENNINLLIQEFLLDKDNLKDYNDNYNISNGLIVNWDFKNIPCPSYSELLSYKQKVDNDLFNLSQIKKIIELESQITTRRLVEAVNNIDNGWLLNLNNEITLLRSTLC